MAHLTETSAASTSAHSKILRDREENTPIVYTPSYIFREAKACRHKGFGSFRCSFMKGEIESLEIRVHKYKLRIEL